MRLVCDDYNQVYYWSEYHDEDIALSPKFDYEEDAVRWQERMRQLLKENNE